MKLLRMTATFGRLEQETLSLTDGLNVLQMPNEAGKSTWAEFLLAMLYGVDTSEREKTGVLPVKTKYQPWSGKPMEGVIELEHARAAHHAHAHLDGPCTARRIFPPSIPIPACRSRA